MIISKNININITNRNISYYKEKSYSPTKGELLYVSIHDLPRYSRVKVKVQCDECGGVKELTYQKAMDNIERYGFYTCRKCSVIKKKLTFNKNYGVDNPMKNESIKIKGKNTKLEKYGDENYNNIDQYKETCKEKYGVEYYMGSNEFKEKSSNTIMEKYGVNHASQSKEIIDKIKKSILLKKHTQSIELYKNKYNLDIISIDNDTDMVNIKCDKCGEIFTINRNTLQLRILYDNNICTICNPIGQNNISYVETELLDFIKENYNGEIITNSKSIIKPYELDIYLPELKLAFEFNGIYWHNELYKDKDYHLMKTNMCNENNIQLLHVWEDDWNYKKECVKSFISNKLFNIKHRIFGRKCIVKEITDNKIIREFLDTNHLQGFVGSKIKLGLYYNNELVSLMTFGSLRKVMNINSVNNTYELLRFCNKLNTSVIGSASKLFKYFIKNYTWDNIVTYADLSYSNGKIYKQLGFEYEHKSPPSYHYVVDNIRKHRFNYRKSILVKQGYDPNKTEHEIMLERKIYRIYNSGNLKYIFKQKLN